MDRVSDEMLRFMVEANIEKFREQHDFASHQILLVLIELQERREAERKEKPEGERG